MTKTIVEKIIFTWVKVQSSGHHFNVKVSFEKNQKKNESNEREEKKRRKDKDELGYSFHDFVERLRKLGALEFHVFRPVYHPLFTRAVFTQFLC